MLLGLLHSQVPLGPFPTVFVRCPQLFGFFPLGHFVFRWTFGSFPQGAYIPPRSEHQAVRLRELRSRHTCVSDCLVNDVPSGAQWLSVHIGIWLRVL